MCTVHSVCCAVYSALCILIHTLGIKEGGISVRGGLGWNVLGEVPVWTRASKMINPPYKNFARYFLVTPLTKRKHRNILKLDRIVEVGRHSVRAIFSLAGGLVSAIYVFCPQPFISKMIRLIT